VRLTIGIPRETFPGERRVAITPRHCDAVAKFGSDVVVERSAGIEAGFTDDQYEAHGARAAGRAEVFQSRMSSVQVRCLGANPEEGRADLPPAAVRPDSDRVRRAAHSHPGRFRSGGGRGFLLRHGTGAANYARAEHGCALLDGDHRGIQGRTAGGRFAPRLFPMLTTAAGTIPPARVLVIGAGVAGLQAIATARRLGAVVSAYDVRAAVKEQIESLGAHFVNITLDGVRAEVKAATLAPLTTRPFAVSASRWRPCSRSTMS